MHNTVVLTMIFSARNVNLKRKTCPMSKELQNDPPCGNIFFRSDLNIL